MFFESYIGTGDYVIVKWRSRWYIKIDDGSDSCNGGLLGEGFKRKRDAVAFLDSILPKEV